MDRDEPRFAQATQEMIERDTLLIPYFNDEYRFDKPPLSYWWMRVHYTLLGGKSELAARLHSVEAALLTAILIAALGRFLFSPRAGLLAGIAWLTSFQVLIHSRLCVADMPMILAVMATGYALARLLLAPDDDPHAHKRFNRWWWMLLGAMVFGFLAKGPIAIITPGLGLVLTRFVFGRGKKLPWARLQPISLVILFLVGIGLWGIPALIETKGEFANEGLGKHVVERGTESFNGRKTIPGVYYLATALISLLPWSVLIPAAFKKDKDEEKWTHRNGSNAFLLGWLAAPYLVFAFYSTQLPHYVMPGFPAFFLLLMRAGTIPLPRSKSTKIFAGFVVVLIATLGGAVALGSQWTPLVDGPAGLSALMLTAGVLLLTAAVASGFAAFGKLTPTVLGVIGCSLIAAQLSAQIRAIHPTVLVMEQLAKVPKGTEFIASNGYSEPSLVFYTDKGWRMNKKSRDAMKWLAKSRYEKRPRAGVLMLREWTANNMIEQLGEGKTPTDLVPTEDDRESVLQAVRSQLPLNEMEFYVVTGYNAAKTSWVELLVCVPVEEVER